MLHQLEQDGKKILAASLNPSSTYLYSVDEEALYKALINTVSVFAEDNGIDMVAISQSKAIRTNRTGGQFEKAMDADISRKAKAITLTEPAQFSYHPQYMLTDLDVVWERTHQAS